MSQDPTSPELHALEKPSLLEGTVYKPSGPTTARVLSNINITPQSEDDWHHLVLQLNVGDYNYLEGQSLGVIAPGEDERGKSHKVRLYSIASARGGEAGQAGTATISVKRLVYHLPDGKRVLGVASDYICNLQVGQEVTVTGPAGKAFVLPKADNVDLLLFATGTGVAPFRAFLYRLFSETRYRGNVTLFYGVRRKTDLAYMNDVNNDLESFRDFPNLRIVTALSREVPTGPKVYVQNRLLEHSDEVWQTIKRENFAVYICGIKGMEKGIDDSFREIAESHGADWDTLKERFKKEGRWNQEVY